MEVQVPLWGLSDASQSQEPREPREPRRNVTAVRPRRGLETRQRQRQRRRMCSRPRGSWTPRRGRPRECAGSVRQAPGGCLPDWSPEQGLLVQAVFVYPHSGRLASIGFLSGSWCGVVSELAAGVQEQACKVKTATQRRKTLGPASLAADEALAAGRPLRQRHPVGAEAEPALRPAVRSHVPSQAFDPSPPRRPSL